ncbi:putative ribonuclease H-like domain-containing protein [Tanacetum coccineum]
MMPDFLVVTNVSTASTKDSTASLSDATIYAFLSNQPNGSQVVHEDLEQIHEDDLEEMDLKWQLALLSMRARRYYQRTGLKITINGSDIVGYDKSKVECFNYHKMGHFTRECRSPRNQESRPRNHNNGNMNQDSSRRTVNVEETSSKAMVAIDGADSEIIALKSEIEKLKKEKECNQIKIDKFENASKCLDKLIGSQISDNSKKCVGYNAIPPPPTGLFAPPTIDLSNSGLEEFQQPEFKGYGPKASKSVCVDTSNEVKKTPDTPLVEELVSEKEKQTGNPPTDDQGYVDSGCFRHMTGNISYLLDFQGFDRGYVTFGGGVRGGKITGKGTLKMGKLDFQDVYFVKELQFNLFSVSQMCDKKNCVLFTDTACFILSPDFKLPDESQILLKIPRKNNLFTWVFFLASKDETSGILKNFITEIENLVDKKVKIIRCDNGTEFKNRVMNEFSRTKLADLSYPTTFWAEAVNTACYVQNRVIIVKPHNKTPYELFRGRTPALSFMRPFGCHVSILNTLDHLGKFDGKSDDGFFVGYSLTSKAFRVYNIRTRKVEENLHIRFLEDKPIVSGNGPKWLFDIDSLTKSMNYVPVIAGTNSNDFAGSEVSIGEGTTSKETDTSQDYIVMPLWKDSSLFDSPSMNVSHDEPEPSCYAEKKDDERVSKASGVDDQKRPESSTLNINTAGPSINTASANLRTCSLHINIVSPTILTTRSNHPQSVSDIISLRDNVTPEAINADLFGDKTEMDMSNLNALYHVPTTPNTRIHKDHVIGDIQSGVQTRGMTKTINEQGLLSVAYERKPHEDLNTSMQEELLQFKLQKGWVLMDLPKGKRAIKEGIDYDEVFAHVARIEAIRLFLAYASFMGFMVYQMDVKSAFLYGQIEEEVYVCQPPGFEDPDYPDKV